MISPPPPPPHLTPPPPHPALIVTCSFSCNHFLYMYRFIRPWCISCPLELGKKSVGVCKRNVMLEKHTNITYAKNSFYSPLPPRACKCHWCVCIKFSSRNVSSILCICRFCIAIPPNACISFFGFIPPNYSLQSKFQNTSHHHHLREKFGILTE